MKSLFLLISCFILLLPSASYALEGKIVVLTTINEKDGKAFWRSNNYSATRNIEKEFKNNMGPLSERIKFIHHAQLLDVSRELNNPENAAIFFVGHGGLGNDTDTTPLSASSVILDSNDVEIQNLFSSINKNVKYLAVISCFSEEILNSTLTNKANNNLVSWKLFNDKIELKKGIKDSLDYFNISESKLTIEDGDVFSTSDENKIKIRITRENIQTHIPTMILINDKVMTVFDGKQTEEFADIEIDKKDLTSAKIISIVHSSGVTDLSTRLNLGDIKLEIDSEFHCNVSSLLNREGELAGVTKNIYHLKCSAYNMD